MTLCHHKSAYFRDTHSKFRPWLTFCLSLQVWRVAARRPYEIPMAMMAPCTWWKDSMDLVEPPGLVAIWTHRKPRAIGFVQLLLCLSHLRHLTAEITSIGRAGGQMQEGASGYNSRYIVYEIRCLQGWGSHERLWIWEREEEREKYSIHIRRKLLCCHQPFSGKHSELVCVAGGGYNCPDMGIVSMDRPSEKVAGVMEGCEVWIQEIGMTFTQCRGKSGSTVRRENCLWSFPSPNLNWTARGSGRWGWGEKIGWESVSRKRGWAVSGIYGLRNQI